MNLKQLEAFVKIANNRSFSKTARELYLTQPTVSAYIGKLEMELGVKLFARTTKEVQLTEAGKKIYLYAKQMVELEEKIEHTFTESKPDAVRQIVLSTSSIPGSYLLPGILAEYSRREPKMEFRINETDSRGVLQDVLEHHADIGFCGTAVRTKNVRYIPFYQDELVIIAPNTEKYRKYEKDPGDLSWLRNETWLMRPDSSGTQSEAAKILASVGIKVDELRVLARFSNTGAILLSVKEGSGIAIVSRLAAASSIAAGDILAIPLKAEGSFRPIYMAVSTFYELSEASRKMIRFVKDMYQK